MLGSDDVDLDVENTDDRSHEFRVVASGDFEERSTAGELDPNQSETVSDFVPRLDYTHAATLAIRIDGEQIREQSVIIRSSDDITVRIVASDDVEIRPINVISPTGEGD
ncbi:hypothetical protein [Halosimplex salinum]|uniref:hypothetical protein n=1 Tax=Halosimplex salinum TaxID=1710538 RepID=UPI000F49ACC4|nr:hypothetical protein [Halosimplex salinum]